MRETLDKMIADLERQGIIEKCQSPYNSPCFLVPKKREDSDAIEPRLVCDHKKLNAVTEINHFPIPLIDDILNSLHGAKIFTTLDIKGAYYQIVMDVNSRDLTAFTAGKYQYRWCRMPMGLGTSAQTWQYTINIILSDLIGHGIYVYLDDVLIYAPTQEEHDKLLREVLERLRKFSFQLKISKCKFYVRKFEYLGHIVSEHGMSPNPRNVAAIVNYPIPKTLKAIQSFLGMCGYYRKYVQDYAQIAKPITMLTKNGMKIIWTPNCNEAFEKLKHILASDVTLKFPDFQKLFYVTTDASDVSISGVISQGDPPDDRPDVNSRLFRQRLKLMSYNFKVIHKPGRQNVVADALSRISLEEAKSIDEILEENNLKSMLAVMEQEDMGSTVNVANINFENGITFSTADFDACFYLVSSAESEMFKRITGKFEDLTLKLQWQEVDERHKRLRLSMRNMRKTKTSTNTRTPMQITSTGNSLFDHTYMDFVGPLPETEGVAIPTKDCTAQVTAECLLEHVILRYNFPSILSSDNAKGFHAKVLKKVNSLLSIKRTFSTPYHPSSNIVERQHRTLNAYLRAYSEENDVLWDKQLKYGTFVYNNTVHSTTGFTPHELAHGFTIQIPTSISRYRGPFNYDDLAGEVRAKIKQAIEMAKEKLTKRKITNKRNYDRNTNPIDVHVGDLILMKNFNKSNKFDNVYEGPFRVIEVQENYVTIMKKNKPIKVNKDHIKISKATHANPPPEVFPVIEPTEEDLLDLFS
ncbi:uncharacterized protein LOC129572548 [Sitodiplosis mosellana]|uniref:uncharacterized protein LOC129572548 n=1 Tax=Sitodiplosis mosellana TaxID=263140 RepID=UPI00244494B8|nr:uncharacterized protein LOC129572548 [Sitodiplosis mosellana]